MSFVVDHPETFPETIRKRKEKTKTKGKEIYWPTEVKYWTTIAVVASALITQKLFPQQKKTQGQNKNEKKTCPQSLTPSSVPTSGLTAIYVKLSVVWLLVVD